MKTFADKLQLFKNKVSEIYLNDSEKILETHFYNRNKTFRINKLKQKLDQEVLESLLNQGIKCKQIEGLDNFYIALENSNKLSFTNEFNSNQIYIQEASSSLPVYEINSEENDLILDMCASPGSKTSLIQNLSDNKANVVAVEKSRNRFFKLKENLVNNGVENVQVFNIDANRLIFIKPEFSNYFNKIIVDVPCTTESKVDLNEQDSLKEWKPQNAKSISKLQRGLLNSAFKMLKPGGTLIYSTCTYSVEENEDVVNWFLKNNSNAKLLNIDLSIKNIKDGVTSYREKKYTQDMTLTKRIIPNNEFTAFYMAKLTKVA